MPLYEIYQVGRIQPLTTVEANDYVIIEDKETHRVAFKKDGNNVAQFNLNNISGFKKLNKQEELDVAAYRNMQALLNDDSLADAAHQLNRAKKITEVYG